MLDLFNQRKKIKYLRGRVEKLDKELIESNIELFKLRSYYNHAMKENEELKKEKENKYVEIRLQVYEDVLKIEKKFVFIPRGVV